MSAGKLKFLVDVGVGRKVEEYLLEKRYDTKAVRALDQKMPDEVIIRLAALEKRIVITMDKDFWRVSISFRNGPLWNFAFKVRGCYRLGEATGDS